MPWQQFSVVFVIQDLYDKNYLREMSNLLLVTMGFKQLCVQQAKQHSASKNILLIVSQESMAATYGAGLTSACVVNLGASCSTIACVDEGLVVPDTRSVCVLRPSRVVNLFPGSRCPWAVTT